jgi:hypothetical protein
VERTDVGNTVSGPLVDVLDGFEVGRSDGFDDGTEPSA